MLGVALPLAGLGGVSSSPVRNGRIAYERLGSGARFQIYTSTSTGIHRRRLTRSPRFSSYSPSYAPDGKRIVFVRSSKQSDLWTMKSDGSHPRPLTRTEGIHEGDPAWSPDGQQIAFSVAAPAADEGIWLIGKAGGVPKRLTNGRDRNPSWSPDGAQIAFQRAIATPPPAASPVVGQIYVVPASGGTPTDLTNDLSVSDIQPAWSPDGTRILFSSDRGDQFQLDLWSMTPSGTNRQHVTNTPNRDEHSPAWSPDGRKIVFAGERSSHGASSYQLYVSAANGSKRKMITHACAECANINDEPSWQPLP